MLLNCVLFYLLKNLSSCIPFLSSFFFFFCKKRFLLFSEESLLLILFLGKAIREKMFLLIIKKKKFFFLQCINFANFITWKHWLVYLSSYIPVLNETPLWNCMNFKGLLPWDKYYYRNKSLEWDSLSEHCIWHLPKFHLIQICDMTNTSLK